jgi:group I intron endonuclease
MKGIYVYIDLETGEIVYVGKDSHIDKKKRHKTHLSPSKYDEQQINKIIQKNPDLYEYSVLYCSNDISDDDLNMLERTFIERYDPKFNFTKGGEGVSGYIHTEETKQKMSKNHADFSGENNPMYNKNHSKESRIKMSESKNTSGYSRVVKQKSEKYKQGFIWRYQYYEKGKRKFIRSVDIKKLEKKVKDKGLVWGRING